MTIKLILEQCGFKPSLRLRSDAQAAIDSSQRLSGTRMRHMTLHQNFVRQLIRGKHATIRKIGTKENVADILTKYCDMKTLQALLPVTGWRKCDVSFEVVKLKRINTVDTLMPTGELVALHNERVRAKQIETGKQLAREQASEECGREKPDGGV